MENNEQDNKDKPPIIVQVTNIASSASGLGCGSGCLLLFIIAFIGSFVEQHWKEVLITIVIISIAALVIFYILKKNK